VATVAVVQAFAAGAILTMLADTMMPEGFEHAGSAVGLATLAWRPASDSFPPFC
jgi:zinc transporter, ZIP family